MTNSRANSKPKPCSLKLPSLNVRGLSKYRKRRAIFTWCRKQKADLLFLQETNSTKNTENQWKKEWGSHIIFSHGSANGRGVAVLNRVRSIEKSGFRFSNPDFGFPNKTRNPKMDFDEPKSFFHVDFN